MERSVLPHPALVERLVALAERLTRLGRPQEAAELLELAAALSPGSRHLRERARRLRDVESQDEVDRELKRRNLEASHAIGMGHVYGSRGELERAAELFDLAKLRNPFHYLSYSAKGFLFLRNGDPASALEEFTQARKLNPLDLRLAVEAARSALLMEDYDTAIEHAVDAMLLSQWQGDAELEQARRRVATLARLCGLENGELDSVVKSRGKALQKAADHVALTHARLFAGKRWKRPRTTIRRPDEEHGDLLERANRLRAMAVFRHFSDHQLVQLAHLARSRDFADAEVLFREGEDSRDIHLVERGTVHIGRRTPAGTQILDTCGPGALFGEVAYLDGGPRSATAFGVGGGTVYVIPAETLESRAAEDRELAVSLLWAFWQSLAGKVRAANAQMGELLSVTGWAGGGRKGAPGRPVELPTEEKVRLLEEQGLSAQELRLLATYSREERYEPESLIFAEGERGDQLYIVVEGKVRISRLVPGMGEETLSILERGEVFGEMALIDDQPRSADARAHLEGCTVFSVSRSLLEEVLSMDPDAAVQFLSLLCRLLCRRLRAMNERLVAWRVMASHS